jgi:anti-sigma regulatory factor (Ser/Thr protein kinase)
MGEVTLAPCIGDGTMPAETISSEETVDWYLPAETAGVGALRQELRSYLDRHATEGSDVEGALLVASELVTNAIEHSDRGAWVSVDWGAANPVLSVYDLGTGFTLEEVPEATVGDRRGRGLMIASHLVEALSVRAREAGGSVVTAVLPVQRPTSPSIDPAPSSIGALPHPSEAGDGGMFGRESFLRALVVRLAHGVELADGPERAEALVAQVGTDVGARMEEAFRAARTIEGALTHDQIAELCVELKAAIDGDFYVIAADEDRIVLGNRRCPFGDAVHHAPALCRMTSSVFGGIAARNRGVAAVDLEQRIAIGDDQCRVTVWLRPPPPEREPFVHVYGAPVDAI